MGYYLLATSDYSGPSENHLSFVKGTRIEFIERVENGMIKGRLEGRVGLLPSALITLDTRPLSIITNNHNLKEELNKEKSQQQQKEEIKKDADQDTSSNASPVIIATTSTFNDSSSTTSTTTLKLEQEGLLAGEDDEDEEEDDDDDDEEERQREKEREKEKEKENGVTTAPTTIPINPDTTVTPLSATTTSTTSTTTTSNSPSLTSEQSNSTFSLNGASSPTTTTTKSHSTMPSMSDLSISGVEKKKKKEEDPNKTNIGLIRKSKSGNPKRRYVNRKRCPRLYISKFEDLPDDIINDLKHEDVPAIELRKNIKVFLTIIKFLTRQKITYIQTAAEKSAEDKNRVEIQTSALDKEEEFELIKDEDERKKRKLELKLERKRTLTGASEEFIEHARKLVKVIPEIKKRMKFGNLIGKGGYGKVFEAIWDKKKYAIKVVHYRTPKEQLNVLIELGFLNRCRHPNIVEFKGAVTHDSQMFIVTEFMQGGNLEMACSSSHVFKETHIGYIGKEILKAIAYLHQNKLVHRDIKSGNIMISLEGDIKLVDFGLCASVEHGSSYHMVGSPYWMPPEMIKGDNHSYPADIWSFGVCILEMMYRRPPHRESRFKAMFMNATQGIDVTKFKCSLDLKDMLWQCFEMDPAKRSNANKLLRHPFFQRAESKQGMKGMFDNMFLQRNLNNTGFF